MLFEATLVLSRNGNALYKFMETLTHMVPKLVRGRETEHHTHP